MRTFFTINAFSIFIALNSVKLHNNKGYKKNKSGGNPAWNICYWIGYFLNNGGRGQSNKNLHVAVIKEIISAFIYNKNTRVLELILRIRIAL